MLSRRLLILGLFLLLCTRSAVAQPPGDPLQELLVSPDVLARHRAELKLTEEQLSEIRARAEKAAPQVQAAQQRSNKAMGRLAELLAADKVDEEAALRQLDEVLAREKEQKRIHLRVMIQIRNALTAEQRQLALRLQRKSVSPESIQKRLKEKLALIENAMRDRAKAGRPPNNVVAYMQKFPELMQNGQVREAESVLDRVLAMLKLNHDAPQGRPQPAQLAAQLQLLSRRAAELELSGKDASRIRDLVKKVGPLLEQGKTKEAMQLLEQAMRLAKALATDKPVEPTRPKNDSPARDQAARKFKRLTPDGVRDAYAALKKDDVAWRKIDWKTCLLDGLAESRQQKKPILLWIFIDRPIDDERC